MSGHRKSTPRGQMTRGANSGPAIMMMPPHIRATFIPNPPLQQVLPPSKRRKNNWTGVSNYLSEFEKCNPQKRIMGDTPLKLKELASRNRDEEHKLSLEPMINEYRQEQRESSGEFEGMNCYNTLFVGRLAYEVTERKLLREFEQFGPVKDLKLIKEQTNHLSHKANKSRGYAFVEFEHEEDMKRAYRAADGLELEHRKIVVDVERGHTVPNWLPRRLGGGLGGTRLGGKDKNVKLPGRYDPKKGLPDQQGRGMGRGMLPPSQLQNNNNMHPPGFGRGGPPLPLQYGGGGFGRGRGGSFGPPRGGGGDRWERHGPRFNDRGPPGGEWNRNKRQRSRSPDHQRWHLNNRRRF